LTLFSGSRVKVHKAVGPPFGGFQREIRRQERGIGDDADIDPDLVWDSLTELA